jgi:maltose alpha-D-glucosyltransferase/alpha-amylase
MAKRRAAYFPLEDDPLWYKDAIIYELHVRAFYDSEGEGTGTLLGLREKLDYLEDLGVTAIWLLPFYPSPLKDDGYDISDYTNIQPIYGTMADFRELVEEAHRRGIRVITELVLNHTSDQHPWFQRARRAAPGTRWRDFYVWNDTPDKYQEARIIFKDYEYSNWAWDNLAKAYYWHRFYSHQPDLNYDNPAVRRAMFRVMDYWLRLGVDGLRVDAVPYLYEREGTNCENLPETHSFLKELRTHIDKKFKNRMLLAEANQWPEDATAYFGDEDEFNVAFHFPLMPRLFMAIRMEDRFPVIDILQQTPSIPETCQWAIFLRNHDELTLEMVTDEERDYMYRVYANDPASRLNLGIRRRLAPLLNNDRRKIELMNGLLFSLPGTPVVYYGDEIGMGDNFYLGDRNGVRTPMQWSPDRNAGFSRANPQRLYLPPIIDPEYHYEAVNVETQLKNTDSLLWWMKRAIAIRKRFKAFGRGSFEIIQPENRRVLAFLRRYQEETILIVANLSHLAQQTQIDLAEFNGWTPTEIFGRVDFTPIGEAPYSLTLSPYAFYWFSLKQQPAETLRLRTLPAERVEELPQLDETEDDLFEKNNWFVLEAVLLEYIKDRRWFRGKARDSWASEIQDVIPMHFANRTVYLVLIEIEYSEGEPEIYLLPLTTATPEQAGTVIAEYPHAAIAHLQPRSRGGVKLLYDASVNEGFCNLILRAMERSRSFRGQYGRLSASRTKAFRNIVGPRGKVSLETSPLKAEQSNTSIVYGNQLILKLYRRPEEGMNPDVEVGRFLTEETDYPNIARTAGALEYHRGRSQPVSLAILQSFVPNEGDAWQYTVDSLDRYFQDVLAHPTVQVPPVPRGKSPSLAQEPPTLAKDTIGPYLASAQLLGRRTAELHLALASVPDDPDFAPEPFSMMYQTSLSQSMRSLSVRTLRLLRERLRYLPDNVREDAEKVLASEDSIIERFYLVRKRRISASRIRCHGDYHLGQVLYTGKDFVIIDFEGEPARSLSERRFKRSPLRDVAGMIRSFHYATRSGLLRQESLIARPEDELPTLAQWAQFWYVWVSSVFLTSYLDEVRQAHLLPEEPEQLKVLLDAYLMEKAIYEIGYELNNRPDWLSVPLQGILQLIEAE